MFYKKTMYSRILDYNYLGVEGLRAEKRLQNGFVA
jgi:hypothetical protein